MTRYTPQWLQAGSYSATQDRRLLQALWPAPAVSGCLVTAGSGMSANVATGQVAVPSQNSTGTTLCTSDGIENVVLAAAPAGGQNRYDLIVCQPRGNDLDGGANNDLIFAAVTGVAAASPAVPATPAGTVALARIFIPGGSASVTAGNIVDVRPSGLSIATPVKARAYRAAAWTHTSGQPCPFDTVNYDPRGIFNLGTGRATVPIAGDYLVTAAMGVLANAANLQPIGYVNLNGNLWALGPQVFQPTSGNGMGLYASDVIPCAAGDILDLRSNAPTGATGQTGTATSYMTVRLLN